MAEANPSPSHDSSAPEESEQLHARAAELTALSRHLILVAEEEKAELARELHDTFGSSLTAINMDLNWIARRLPADRPELCERLQRALRMLGETVAIKQEVIDRLRPSQLDTLGLAVALRTHCREWANRTGGRCEIEASEDFEALDRTTSIALFRVALEALASLEGHAGTQLTFELSRNEKGVRLRITDESAALARVLTQIPKGEGPVGMRERVRAVGGTLTISTVTEQGACIDAFVPS